jgi:hypothetical protein
MLEASDPADRFAKKIRWGQSLFAEGGTGLVKPFPACGAVQRELCTCANTLHSATRRMCPRPAASAAPDAIRTSC